MSAHPGALAVIGVLSLALWLWVVVDVRARRDIGIGVKRFWVVAAFIQPVLVSLVYIVAGRRRAAS
jgi:hypothetical protein